MTWFIKHYEGHVQYSPGGGHDVSVDILFYEALLGFSSVIVILHVYHVFQLLFFRYPYVYMFMSILLMIFNTNIFQLNVF